MMFASGTTSRQRQAHHYSSNWRPRASHGAYTYQAREKAYDHDSGVVYLESRTSVPKKQAYDWIGESRNRRTRIRWPKSGLGTHSLVELAIRSIVKNIRGLTPDHLYEVHWSLAERIWDHIVESGFGSFHAWRTFASVYPEQFAVPGKRYHLTIKEPFLPLNDYFHGLDCSPPRWVSSIRISPRYTHFADLVGLTSIRNLVVLDLSDDLTIDAPLGHFDERVMRAWVESIQTQKSFRHLRVLMLGWQDHASSWVFKYLNHFPSLCAVIFTDCVKLHQRNRSEWEEEAQSHGWHARAAKPSAKSLRPILGDAGFHIGTVSGAYYETTSSFSTLTNPRRPVGMEEHLPLVECSFGRPRLWTHILDDFPSTRTVWVENGCVQGNTSPSEGKVLKRAEVDQIGPGSQRRKTEAGVDSEQRHRQGNRTINDLLANFNGT